MKADHKESSFKEILIVTLLFLFGILFHFYFSDYTKAIEVYPDELRYYGIARSIFNGDGISIRGIDTDFQKIAYTLMLVPFFAIKNAVIRIKVISLINCIVMMSSVFPIWLITKELGLKKKARFLVVLISIVWPDAMLTMIFMSEVLYWPIFFWFMYIWVIQQKKQKMALSVLEGIVCYIGYLCREIFIAVFLAYIILEIGDLLLTMLIERKNRLQQKSYIVTNRIVRIIVFSAVFIFCHLILKVTIFHGLGNSYQVMDISVILKSYNFFYMIYGFFYYLAALLVASLFLPFLYPALEFKNMEQRNRRLYSFSILFFVISAAIVSYTITVREDLGRILPRIHLRYVGPAFMILIILFLICIQSGCYRKSRIKGLNYLLIIVSGLLFGCGLFKGLNDSVWVDQQLLNWYVLLQRKTGILMGEGENTYVIYPYVMIANIVLAVIVFGLFYIRAYRSEKLMRNIFVSILFVVCMIDDFSAAGRRFDASVDPGLVTDIVNMSHYFENHKDRSEKILYLSGNSPLYKCMDTYFDEADNLYFADESLITSAEVGKSISVSDIELHEPVMGNIYEGVDQINYFIVENSLGNKIKQFVNTEIVQEISGENFTVYHNLNPDSILIDYDKKLCFDGNEMQIYFSGDKYNAGYYVLSGISQKETGFSWTSGNKMEVWVPVIGKQEKVEVVLTIGGTFHGKKTYIISQEGKEIVAGTMEGEGEIAFELQPSDRELKFEILLPDAQVVSDVYENSTDGRKVAFQLKKMIIR